MVETTESSASNSSSSSAAAGVTSVRAVDGFFAYKPQAEKSDPLAPGALYRNYEMLPASWAEFQQKFAQMEKGEGSEGTARCLKMVHFVRHGEGIHNVAQNTYGWDRWIAEYAMKEEFMDSDLTPFGIKDAQTKGPPVVVAELARGMPPIERVVVSPLSRTIQTAQNFFAKGQVPDAPFVCLELCRELLDTDMCNKRRSVTELKRKFPDVDFSAIKDEEDVLWSPTHHETMEETQARARQFLVDLFHAVPERNVVVVAHAGFIQGMRAALLGTTVVQPDNCEAVPLVLEGI